MTDTNGVGIVGVNTIGIPVVDQDRALVFYRDVLGFAVVSTDSKPVPHNDWILLELNGVQLMLNTAA